MLELIRKADAIVRMWGFAPREAIELELMSLGFTQARFSREGVWARYMGVEYKLGARP